MPFFHADPQVLNVCEFSRGNTTIQVTTIKRWDATGKSHTVRCGIKSGMRFKSSIGVHRAHIEQFQNEVGGSLGADGIASLSSRITEETSQEFRIEEMHESEHSFEYESEKKCGRQSWHVHQLVIDYHFQISKKRLFGSPVIKSFTLTKKTEYFDTKFELDDDIEECPCPKNASRQAIKLAEGTTGITHLIFGNVCLRMDFYETAEDKLRIEASSTELEDLLKDHVPSAGSLFSHYFEQKPHVWQSDVYLFETHTQALPSIILELLAPKYIGPIVGMMYFEAHSANPTLMPAIQTFLDDGNSVRA